MNYSLDIENEYREIRNKLLRLSLFYSLILALVIVGDVLLVVLSKDNYVAEQVIASIITALFVWFSIFFFSAIYSEVNKKYRYYKGYESGLKRIEEVEILKKSDELEYVNGLYVYPIYVRIYSVSGSDDKIIYTLDENLNIEIGDKVTATTYQRILVKAEKHS